MRVVIVFGAIFFDTFDFDETRSPRVFPEEGDSHTGEQNLALIEAIFLGD